MRIGRSEAGVYGAASPLRWHCRGGAPMLGRPSRTRPPTRAISGGEDPSVATHKSAEKRARQDAKRRDRNRVIKSRAKSTVKSLRADIDAGSAALRDRLRETESVLRKAASRGAIPKRRASRLVSRLAKRVARAKSK